MFLYIFGRNGLLCATQAGAPAWILLPATVPVGRYTYVSRPLRIKTDRPTSLCPLSPTQYVQRAKIPPKIRFKKFGKITDYIFMLATVWQILNMKPMHWPETEIILRNSWNHFEWTYFLADLSHLKTTVPHSYCLAYPYYCFPNSIETVQTYYYAYVLQLAHCLIYCMGDCKTCIVSPLNSHAYHLH